MKRLAIFIVTVICCGILVAHECFGADKSSGVAVGPEAIWHPSESDIKSVFTECGSGHVPDFGKCFVAFMRGHGASPQAVAFAKLVHNNGYLRAFRKVGPADIAYVAYPFTANTNYGYLLVNGQPSVVNVDDLAPVRDALTRSSSYGKLVARFPKAAVWPGDRFSKRLPITERLKDGSRRFIVGYYVTDFCHACRVLARVRCSFDFDGSGKFLGVTVVGIEKPGARGGGQ
jgi:hypothetical protein